jgi:hypothetical protein
LGKWKPGPALHYQRRAENFSNGGYIFLRSDYRGFDHQAVLKPTMMLSGPRWSKLWLAAQWVPKIIHENVYQPFLVNIGAG